MSKKKSTQSSGVSWGSGYVVGGHTPNRIIGNVLTLVEILGLTQKQEEPFKDLIRQRIWDAFNEGVPLSEETHTKIREQHEQMYAEARRMNLPPMAL